MLLHHRTTVSSNELHPAVKYLKYSPKILANVARIASNSGRACMNTYNLKLFRFVISCWLYSTSNWENAEYIIATLKSKVNNSIPVRTKFASICEQNNYTNRS